MTFRSLGSRKTTRARSSILAGRYSDEFPDPVKLLAAAENPGWIKVAEVRVTRSIADERGVEVTCRAWRKSTRDRWELFER